METGIVKWFKEDKGYGSIQSDSGAEFFFDTSAVAVRGNKKLTDGQKVRFIVEHGPKGPVATDIKLSL